jgi:1-deoxy-D-xylulose-5-phosphate reductoisomerase
MKRLSILGSTGTIGRQTLEIVRRHPREFRVAALAAGGNLDLLAEQIREFRPAFVSLADKPNAERLRTLLGTKKPRIAWGPQGAEEAGGFEGADLVVSAITGIVGLRPTLAAVRAGKTIALANKESMVVAGPFLRREAARSGAVFLPVDSEHSGVFQCLAGQDRSFVRNVILTASGGPFLSTPLRELRTKTVREALRHPRWKMGRKVTIDSATLMNKGLELIEARWLFDIPPDRLGVLIHPQSIVHALVEMRDGSVLAQLSATDMRIPIQYALTYPARREAPVPALDLAAVSALEFRAVDERRFPLLGTARAALEEAGAAPVVLNAANEAAVEAFLAGRIGFCGIADVIRAVLEAPRPDPPDGLDAVFAVDRQARERARHIIERRS